MANRRALGLVVAVVAVALTVTGLVLAATDPNPSGVTRDPLALNGYPPKTARITITAATNGLQASATVEIDFRHSLASAVVNVGLTDAGEAFNAELQGRHLLVRSAAESSGPWYQVAAPTIPYFGLSLELTKPDIALITGFTSRTETTSGYLTTYTYARDHVALTPLFAPAGTASRLGSVTWSITLGSQGEVTASTLSVTAGHQTSTLSATVDAYNSPRAVILAPVTDVSPVPSGQVASLLHSAGLGSILVPKGLLAGATATVS
jgi:hypothetical protein